MVFAQRSALGANVPQVATQIPDGHNIEAVVHGPQTCFATLTRPDQTSTMGNMRVRNISEAKAQLSALIEAVGRGEEVIIGKAGVPVARLVAYRGAAAVRTPGRLAGKIRISKDFDELPTDLAEALGMTP